MNDNFQQEIDKIHRMEKILKADLASREDLFKKDQSTTMV